MIGDNESAGQALALAVSQEKSDFQPISNLIMINRLPKLDEKSFQIDTDSTVSSANKIRWLDVSIENLSKPFNKLEVLQTMCIKHYENSNKTSRSALVYPEAVTQNCLRNPSDFSTESTLEEMVFIYFGNFEGVKVMTQPK